MTTVPKYEDFVKKSNAEEEEQKKELDDSCKKLAKEIVLQAQKSEMVKTTVNIGGEDWKDKDRDWNAHLILKYIKAAGWPVTMEYSRGNYVDLPWAKYHFDFTPPSPSQK